MLLRHRHGSSSSRCGRHRGIFIGFAPPTLAVAQALKSVAPFVSGVEGISIASAVGEVIFPPLHRSLMHVRSTLRRLRFRAFNFVRSR